MTNASVITKGSFGAYERPDWLELFLALGLAAALAAYLPILLYRVTELGFGDAQVFFRAAWAVRTGYPLYDVTDNHGWSYHYPPTFAILMGPFADPLPGHPPLAFALPFAASVAIWYAISVAALVLAAHIWASALERHSGLTIGGGRTGWWLLRGAPILMIVPYIGTSFAQGQPTTLLVLLVAAFLSLYADRRPVAASAALGLAIAIKLFPAALLFIPLLRRDFRMLLYTGIWSCVFLFVLPALVLGVEPTIGLYRTLWIDRLSGIADGANAARVEAEISPWANDMVSFGAMLARTLSEPAADMPYQLPAWAKAAQWLFDLALLILVAAVGRGRFWRLSGEQPDNPYALLLAGAVLFAALPAMIPVAQSHYWAHALLLAAILIVGHWRQSGKANQSWRLTCWSALAFAAYIATGVTLWAPLRHHGPSTIVMLGLIAAGFVLLARLRRVSLRRAEISGTQRLQSD